MIKIVREIKQHITLKKNSSAMYFFFKKKTII